ncbi:MAG: NADPH:quinone oxidoreductase family protein [Actinobacteria bacterium]|nr:NADPH:quinone oxidoreductase family protein [Actinomycetota bacterium]
MKAIYITEFGGPEVMKYLDLAEPVPAGSQVLLDVTSIGINYADTHQTENSYLSTQKLPLIPGMEVVGRMPDGSRVLALAASGGYCQKTLVNPKTVIPLPDQISDGQALAMMVQGSTAHLILKKMGQIRAGESVVIHAGAGGVGSVAIQLAKLWGAFVIAVTSSDEKKKLCMELGADVVVDANEPDLTAALIKANNGKGVDLILEMVGGTTFDQSLDALAAFGRLVVYGMASRSAPKAIHPGALMPKSQSVIGFWLVNALADKELMAEVFMDLFGMIISGKLKPVIGSTYPLSKASDAHRDMLARKTVGKIVLDPAN